MRTSPVIGLAVRAAALTLAASLTLAACGGSDAPDDASATSLSSTTGSSASTTTAPATTTTTAKATTTTTTRTSTTRAPGQPKPPSTSKIDAAYVQRVLDRLHGLFQQAFITARTENGFSERYIADMSAAFTSKAVAVQTTGIQRFGGLAVVAPAPGRPTTTGIKLLQVTTACVLASARIDLSPLVTKPITANGPYYVKLVAENKSTANPTPWLIDFESFTTDGRPPVAAASRCTP